MKYRKSIILAIAASSLWLSACNNKVLQDSKETDAKNSHRLEKIENKISKEDQEEKELYKEMEKPVEEVVDSIEKDKVKVIDSKIVEKPKYDDPNEFANKLAKVLFSFSTNKMTASEYYSFLDIHASSSFKDQYLPNKEEGILYFENIQGLLTTNNPALKDDYTVTEVKIEQSKIEGYFYRRMMTSEGKPLYYITTIVKEQDGWKFQDDSPAPPFDEQGGIH
jgi:hypothetical protein